MSPDRIGNFTSSEIFALLSMGSREMSEQERADHKKLFPKSQKKTIEHWPGKAALTYIQECNMERRLGRSLSNDDHSKPTSWGKLCELRVFNLLGLQYKLCSTDTLSHPTISCWKGSPDLIKFDVGRTVVDIKCPQTPKSFCQLVDAWESGKFEAIREMHADGEKFYWQLVSNAVITDSKFAELIVYCPYQSELDTIRELARTYEGEKANRFMWIALAADDELPYLIKDLHYNNINVMRFEVPQADKDLLTDRVKKASEKLITIPKQIAA